MIDYTGTEDFCGECCEVVKVVDDSTESDNYGAIFHVLHLSCGHTFETRI